MNKKTLKREQDLLIPKQDIVFQALFGRQGSENILGGLLKPILNQDVENISLEANQNLVRELPEEKLGILDIRANIGKKTQVNIEVQMVDEHNMAERLLYYWSRIYGVQLKKGKLYNSLKKTISILITNYEIPELSQFKKAHTEWHLLEKENTDIIFFKNIEIHIIEIPKMLKNKLEEEKELRKWIKFLDSPESEEVQMGVKENKQLEEAVRTLQYISGDENFRRQVEFRWKCKLDKLNYDEWKRKTSAEIRNKQKKLKNEEERIQNIQKDLENTQKNLENTQKNLENEQKKFKNEQKKLENEQKNFENKQKQFEDERIKLEEERKKFYQKLIESKIPIEEIEKILGKNKDEILSKRI